MKSAQHCEQKFTSAQLLAFIFIMKLFLGFLYQKL